MAAPTPTTRQSPNGIIVPEGYRFLVTLARLPNVAFWEKSSTPAGIDGGDAIDITTQHNLKTKTFYPRKLYTPGVLTIKAGIDAKTKDTIRSTIINQPDTITETYPDGSTYCYFGTVTKYEESEFSMDTFPEATITIKQTNYDHVNHVEAEAVFTEVTGT